MTLVPNKTTESRVSLWLLHTIFFFNFSYVSPSRFFLLLCYYACAFRPDAVSWVWSQEDNHKILATPQRRTQWPTHWIFNWQAFLCGGEMPISVKIQGFTPYPDVSNVCSSKRDRYVLEPRRGSFKTFRRKSETCERQYGAPVYGYYTVKNSHWKR